MKAEIHPEYKETTIQCTCGAVYPTRSTVNDLRVGICGACHPFFTGEQRFVDTAGRVEKFAKRYGSSQERRAEKPRREVEPQKPKKKKVDEGPPEEYAPAELIEGDDAAADAPAEVTEAAAEAPAKVTEAPAKVTEAPAEAPAEEATETKAEEATDSAEA